MITILASASAWVAGALILISMAPEIVSNWRSPRRAIGQSPWRSALQAAGNLLWAVNGLATGNTDLTLVAGLGSLLAAILLVQALGARLRDV
jgi:hypothetical protein